MHQAEVQKENRLTDRIHKLEKELSLKEPLAQEKHQLWANIINLVNDIWPSIQIIFEQGHLVKEVGEEFRNSKPILERNQRKPLK